MLELGRERKGCTSPREERPGRAVWDVGKTDRQACLRHRLRARPPCQAPGWGGETMNESGLCFQDALSLLGQ